jgi:ABC-type polysaccharide/polyol phosphate export permease
MIYKETNILPKSTKVISYLKTLVYYKDLIALFFIRDFKVQYTRTKYGFLWFFLQPTLYFLIIYTIFGLGLKSYSSHIENFGLYILAGIIPWIFFSQSVNQLSVMFLNYKSLFAKVNFPTLVIPIAVLCLRFVEYLFMNVLFIIFCFFYFEVDFINIISIIGSIIFSLLFTLAFSLLTIVLVGFKQQLRFIVGIFLMLFFYSTPIFWEIGMLSDSFQNFYKYHPLYLSISLLRQVFNSNYNLIFVDIAISFGLCIVFLFLVLKLYIKFEFKYKNQL